MPVKKWTKADILDTVYVQTGMNKNHIKSVYEIIFSEIKAALIAGKAIELRGFGTFESRFRNARKTSRNPKTGEIVSVPQHRTVFFRPGQELKLAVWKIPDKETPADDLE